MKRIQPALGHHSSPRGGDSVYERLREKVSGLLSRLPASLSRESESTREERQIPRTLQGVFELLLKRAKKMSPSEGCNPIMDVLSGLERMGVLTLSSGSVTAVEERDLPKGLARQILDLVDPGWLRKGGELQESSLYSRKIGKTKNISIYTGVDDEELSKLARLIRSATE